MEKVQKKHGTANLINKEVKEHKRQSADEETAGIPWDCNTEPNGQNRTEDLHFCDCCGEGYPGDELSCVETGSGTEYYCRSCLETQCFWCNDCENYYTNDDYICYNGNRVCRSCADEYYHYCRGCECYVSSDDYNYDRDRCYECARYENTGVEDYHESGYWDFIGE